MRFQKYEKYLFTIGILITFCYFIPYFLLGEASVISYHDQLDGEVMAYILHAKYLFSGQTNYLELMNGIPTTGLTPPAPFAVIFYCLFSPFAAFVCLQILAMLSAYVGMYFCLRTLTDNKWIATLCAVLFAYLPTLSVYGLSILGQPLLLWALYQLYRVRNPKENLLRSVWLPLMIIILFAGFSSLTLIGYGIVVCVVIAILGTLIQRKKAPKRMIIGFVVLLSTYILTNLPLIQQIMDASNSIVSHRTEFTQTPTPFWDTFRQFLFVGANYAQGWHKLILPLAIIICIGGLLFKKIRCKQYTILVVLLGCNVIIASLCALLNTSAFLQLRRQFGDLAQSFQADRISWLMPMLWYIILGLSLYICKLVFSYVAMNCKRTKLITKSCLAAVMSVTILYTSFTILYNNPIKFNIKKLLIPGSDTGVTWHQYYAPDLFDQVKELTDSDLSGFRVVSLGIYPAAALYNGFYCLDGYSNNYPLAYKHEFRRVIAPELAKNEELSSYFDDWGNRCYFFSAELGTYSMCSKQWDTLVRDIDFDTTQLKAMGGKYLISAVYLWELEDKYKLLNEIPIETPTSYYRLFVYEIL